MKTRTRTIKLSQSNFAAAIEEFINRYYFISEPIIGLSFKIPSDPKESIEIKLTLEKDKTNVKENINDCLPSDTHHDAGTS